MNKDSISIEKVEQPKFRTPLQLELKGWKVLATVKVIYHEISIHCLLIEGYCQEKKGNFYFLELPCLRFRNGKRWTKSNLFHFFSKEDSDKFQEIAFGLVLEKNPELFPNVFKEMREAQQNLESNKIKARNKSKFAKE